MSDKTPLYQPPQQGTTSGYNAAPPPAYSQGGYPPAQPPPTHNATTVVVTQPAPTVVHHTRYGSGDHFLLLSIIMSFVCFFSVAWYTLICTIPAIFMAINAQEAESRGDRAGMERNRRYALYLNIGALVTGVVAYAIIILYLIIFYSIN